MVAVGVVLRHLHRFQLLQASFLGNLVLALVGVVFQMPHVGNVAHIAHFVSEVLQIAKHHIEGDGWASMPQMSVAIDGGAAHIHTHPPFNKGAEEFLLPCQGIVYQ